ncbi:MAG: Fic family protein [Candidatus Woesebacteria bacterium]|jgi:Fic family protein|nr:MAG: Fic family protein [Candidatus Woesebacteria bacterium]
MYQPKYTITNKILTNIGKIEAAKEVIENAPLVPSFEKQFQSDAFVRTVHHGTHIEGNDLSLLQTRKVLEGEAIVAKHRDIQEVINYRNVVELLEELAFKKGGYEIEMITEIHRLTTDKLVSDEEKGVFRKVQVVVKNEETGEAILKPPAFVEVPHLIGKLMEFLNSDLAKEIHPVLLAGITHYFLVAVHPFVEGNGRTARAFSTLVLIKSGYDIKRFFSLEEHFDSDPLAYYQALAEVDKQAVDVRERDLTSWLEYFTGVVAIELEKVKEKVRRISLDTRFKLKVGTQVALTERQMRLIEYISDRGGAGMKELRNVLKMVSEDTILRDLRVLLEKGIIKKEGSTKASRYVIAGK